MASLLQTDAAGLNEAAKASRQIYPIAARCGVFAKTDIQPLINEGTSKADLAASVFQAVVNQTISGLARGKPIRGNVAFLGGPLHYLTELRAAFARSLKLEPGQIIAPEDGHLFAAFGAAFSPGGREESLSGLAARLESEKAMAVEIQRLEPLFRTREEYDAFLARHAKAAVEKGCLEEYRGDCFLGIDAGSTTTKLALVSAGEKLLFSSYDSNEGSPLEAARRALLEMYALLPSGAWIARSCATGYGEALMKAAFRMEEGEVETVAHSTAAAFFDPEVDCVLDIGGQDMKCIRLKNGTVDTVMLNEACSSGCGSFLENFAASLGMTASEFAEKALFAESPVDLGTRCTVFMNSNVKQAQKEGAPVSDISAGLACSVVRNALFKVIRLADVSRLGSHIVVQGGTFCNRAVLRAFERITGMEVICPDISGIMGAFGAALIARERYAGQPASLRGAEETAALNYSSGTARCGGCENNCMLTVTRFDDGARFVSGNRCEKRISSGTGKKPGANLFEYKRRRVFAYEPLQEAEAPRGIIGLPRVLNMYENYPFWAVFFRALGFRAVLSPFSTRRIYEMGMDSIPSESECYPAKLAHGHVQWLYEQGIRTIFHPCVFYEHQETPQARNHYNCPMVISSAENMKNNVEAVTSGEVRYLRPFLAFTDERTVSRRLERFCLETWNIPVRETRAAVHLAWTERGRVREDIAAEGRRVLEAMRAEGRRGLVLAGRPYHIDPEINHGVPELAASFGFDVFTEDSLPTEGLSMDRPLRVVDQWAYHSRLYNAAEFVSRAEDLDLIQLFSFGCGLDAVTTDQVQELLEGADKLYTLLKIDEVGNLGAARIRIRSLIAALDARRRQRVKPCPPATIRYERKEFTREMFQAGYTLLAPSMSPLHFNLLEPIFTREGYRVVLLSGDSRSAVDYGLRYVNNDACYLSIITTGMFMEAVLSGKYDTNRLAIVMSQTGGCCRASNYVSFIRRALSQTGLAHIPVVSVNLNGMEKNGGFSLSASMLFRIVQGLVLGDVLMRCLYRTRPYEAEPGAAKALRDLWTGRCRAFFGGERGVGSYLELCRGIVRDFDALPLREEARKPRVGIVGEILVKYMPLANNHLAELLEEEGTEAVVPDLLDFLNMCMYNREYEHRNLGGSLAGRLGVDALARIRRPAVEALSASCRFEPPPRIRDVAEHVKPFLSIGNQYGESWLLCGEMIGLIRSGTDNIVCIQPFGCLPNHVLGKGIIKALKAAWPKANIAAIDYDPGASEVNQRNRIRLLLAAAARNLKDAPEADAPLGTLRGA